MSEPRPTDSDRNRALSLLAGFESRLLPGVLRRIGAWKAIPAAQLAQLRDDVVQELSVDCLTHASEIVAMPERDRHARWMQVTERTLYGLRRHQRRCQPLLDEPSGTTEATWIAEPSGITEPSEVAEPSAATEPTCLPGVELPPLVPLHNGRANVAESARRAGLGRRRLRRQLDELAARLGWDEDRRRFWQARTAEAMVGLAADLLRARHAVLELDAPPTLDLPARLDRLRRLAQRFPVQPSTLAVRRALQPWLRRRPRRPPTPRELLRTAVELQPDRAAGWLWLFECCCVERDAPAATEALRRARGCADVPRAAMVLARARLLELRGREPAAVRLVERARRRRDPDGQLARALALAEPPG
jgi:hypothetical protein